ncbi:MAG TPA: hypothetical protein VJ793_01090 [Anaerolineae bacterium]|nr:hypothetical protein [Anaerolineae bacterium]
MAAFVRVVEQFAAVLYIVCLAGMAWSLRSAWLANRESRDTLYSLEREAATARMGRGLLSALGFVALGAAVFVVAQVVAPRLPAGEAPTPTPPGPLVTLTPTVTPFPTPTPISSPTPAPSPNATVAAIETIETSTPAPTPIPLPPEACPDPNVRIAAPGDGTVLAGAFQVFGTANIENFAFYKFVLNGPATNFEDRTAGDVYKTPVVDSYLGTVDESLVANLLQSPGAYRFKLIAVNNEGNEAPACTITLQFLPSTPAPR